MRRPSPQSQSKNSSKNFASAQSKIQSLTGQIEIVVDGRTGEVRQAGSDRAGEFIADLKRHAERSLYVFAKVVMGYDLLSAALHLPLCNTLQESPPYRKLILLPRGHLKTTVLKAMSLHMLIQPDGANAYFPKQIGACGHSQGTSTRILFASKSADLARSTLSEVMLACETNPLLRAFWPQSMWEDPRKQARWWNQERLVLPRRDIFKEASIETIGVGGQITGYHFNVHIFDDLVDINDANSPTTMQTAIEWWKASRALMDDPDKSLEYTVGTRWAVNDLYQYIAENDPSVEPIVRRVVEDGKPIFPERFSLATVERLRRELQTMFPLLYMNNATDSSLTDFQMEKVRYFTINNDCICFEESPGDALSVEREGLAQAIRKKGSEPAKRGTPFTWDAMISRNEYLKLRHPKVE